VKLHVKLRDDATEADRDDVVGRLARLPAAAEPLFPDAPDELSRLFVVSVADDDVSRALELLGELNSVEYAEPEPGRRLVE
jgi:hypothetical protein